ncbi:hypothetical protein LX36DRAFT_415649 [Colletotrichum falcatum]|nr:hypothetical protein LX36DRAFT_415649 [Colletotrichum falcatum]
MVENGKSQGHMRTPHLSSRSTSAVSVQDWSIRTNGKIKDAETMGAGRGWMELSRARVFFAPSRGTISLVTRLSVSSGTACLLPRLSVVAVVGHGTQYEQTRAIIPCCLHSHFASTSLPLCHVFSLHLWVVTPHARSKRYCLGFRTLPAAASASQGRQGRQRLGHVVDDTQRPEDDRVRSQKTALECGPTRLGLRCPQRCLRILAYREGR